MNKLRAQHPVASRTRTAFAASVAVLLGILVSGGFGADVARVEAADGVVSGRVYQDFDSDGSYDTAVAVGTATDIGLSGISVRAFDAAGAQVGSATSSSDGTYSLAVSSASTSAVRVEFSLPSSGPLTAMEPSFAGSQNGTSIRFVDIGATNVDMGYNVPGEYCQNNPNLSVSRLCKGANAIGTAASAWITRYDGGPYSAANGWSNVYNNWATTKVATQSVTGSILGMAWDPSTRRVFHSTYVRRHALMYEVGGKPVPGGVFVTTPQGTSAAAGVGGTTSFLIDLESLMAGDQFSNSNASGPGYIPTNAARKLEYLNNGVGDGGAENDGVDSDLVAGQDGVFEEVGKAGIGDIASDGDGNLYVVSLYDKNLYKVVVPASGAPTTMTSLGDITSGVTCANGSGRPFSVKLWRGALYLGVVCDASGDFDASAPGALANTNLSFTIVRYDLRSFTWSKQFGPHPLNTSGRIQKGNADTTQPRTTYDAWNPWTSTYANTFDTNGLPNYSTRPQPMLSEIEFDRDGSLILAFRDRNADIMSGFQSEAPDGSESPYYNFASGDLYRVCRTGAGYEATDYTFEGTAGCEQTGSHLSDPAKVAKQGKEYYWGDFWWRIGNDGHGENVSGLTALGPGFPDFYASSFDPMDGDNSANSYYSGGIRSYLNSTGGPSGSPNAGSGILFYASVASGINSTGGFDKTNGMSDIELLCDQAPLQIGNRVWIDTDKDGIQDPGETPVAGATVRLYDANGALVGTAVTNAQGEYYFASNVTEAAAGDGNNVGGGLLVNAAFTIKLDNPADYAAGGPLNGYVLTSTDSSTTASTDVDNSIDNDSALVGGTTYGVDRFPSISMAAHRAGQNDHTFDFGFVNPIAATNTLKVSVGDYVWWDIDRDGIQDANEKPISGVTLTITKADGSPVTEVNGKPVTTTVTDANGKYSFDNLPVGQYKVTVTPPVGATATKAGAGKNTAKDSSTGSATSRNMTTDGDRDPTLDFGFYKPMVSVGNFVWRDTNGDGVQSRADKGVAGFRLTLRGVDGSPVVDVYGRPVKPIRTKSDGKFLFKDLPEGRYVVEITYPRGYLPTTPNRADRGLNSSTLTAVSKSLKNGESDMTLDFGVVKRPGEVYRLLPATL